MSSFKSSIFTKLQQSNSSSGDGYISWTWNEDRSYWTNGGGGGGAGGRIYATIEADNIGSNVSATLDVGAGGAGVNGTSSGGGGAVVYGGIKAIFGIRLSEEDEAVGSDLAIHRISSVSDKDW